MTIGGSRGEADGGGMRSDAERNDPCPIRPCGDCSSLASVVLLLTPGPAVLYIVARSVEQGRAAGLVSVLGIHLGTIVHITAAAVGLSALVVSSALAFAIVKYLGAAYLIWIGIRTLDGQGPDPEAPAVPAEPLRRAFRDGFVVNLFNPKTAIFFLAFLPQFVDPARGALHWQILVLGLTFMGLGIISDGDVRAGGRGRRRLPPPQPALPALPALVRRHLVHRPRGHRSTGDAQVTRLGIG